MGGGVKGFNLKWLQNSVEIKMPTGEVELISSGQVGGATQDKQHEVILSGMS